MNIEQKFLTQNQYSRPGAALKQITKIAVHYVGNPKSTAINNRNYFENLKNQIPDKDNKYCLNPNGTYVQYNGEKVALRWVSSHFIVGLDGEVIQCIPLGEVAYCTNQANSYSISIETCHLDTTGKFSAVTEQSLAELVSYLLDKFSLTVNDVIRHYDVTGKQCPLYYVTSSAAWSNFKSMVSAELDKLSGGAIATTALDDTVSVQKLFYVQVGAFIEEKNAKQYLNEVKKTHADAFIKPYNGMFYVQVGAFSSNIKAVVAKYVDLYRA